MIHNILITIVIIDSMDMRKIGLYVVRIYKYLKKQTIARNNSTLE